MENWLGCERLLYSIRMDSGRSEGKRKTQKYLEKDSRERAKQSGVEELGGSQSGCTRQKVLVRQQHGGLMRQLARWDMMMTRHDDDSRWWCAMELNVSEEITCNRQNHSFLSNKYTSQALYQTLQTTKWTYWKAARQYLIWSFQKHYCNPVSIFKFGLRLCPNLYLLCYLYTSFSLFEQSFFYVLYSLLWQFFHCFNLINFLNTLSFFKQTAGRNNLISLLCKSSLSYKISLRPHQYRLHPMRSRIEQLR